ncbi:MAG TPA: SIMPL domain-containing protein [Thermoanaerobaculia bacterium]|nr:SIMPL domain-containing protein [Thermoanaerobaculia bacterium]
MNAQLMVAVLAFSVASAVDAQVVSHPVPQIRGLESVSVSGTGKVSLVPDRVTFTLGVQTIAPTVDDAVSQNNTKVARVIAALKRSGAAEKEIQTANFFIMPQQDYSQGQLPRILGYQVSNNVTVTRDKVGDAGRLLQAGISAGVNQASGLNFTVADPTRGREAALKAAFEDARAKAQILAESAGRTLGRAMMISEGASGQIQPPYPMGRVMTMKAEAQADVPVEQGTEEVIFMVSAVFELR